MKPLAVFLVATGLLAGVARAELKYGHNQELRHLALSMIAEREHEMSVMRNAFGAPAASDTSEHSSDRRSHEE